MGNSGLARFRSAGGESLIYIRALPDLVVPFYNGRSHTTYSPATPHHSPNTTIMENDTNPFPVAPGPWTCKGEAFWLLTYTSQSSAAEPLSSAAFGPLEESAFRDVSKSGTFKGGLGSIMVVRYTSSPVGPYDELLYIPGKFTVPLTGEEKMRITRIYVSTKASVYNGK